MSNEVITKFEDGCITQTVTHELSEAIVVAVKGANIEPRILIAARHPGESDYEKDAEELFQFLRTSIPNGTFGHLARKFKKYAID